MVDARFLKSLENSAFSSVAIATLQRPLACADLVEAILGYAQDEQLLFVGVYQL